MNIKQVIAKYEGKIKQVEYLQETNQKLMSAIMDLQGTETSLRSSIKVLVKEKEELQAFVLGLDSIVERYIECDVDCGYNAVESPMASNGLYDRAYTNRNLEILSIAAAHFSNDKEDGNCDC